MTLIVLKMKSNKYVKWGKIIKYLYTHKCIMWWEEEEHDILGRVLPGGGPLIC